MKLSVHLCPGTACSGTAHGARVGARVGLGIADDHDLARAARPRELVAQILADAEGAPQRALEIAAQALQPRTFAPDTVLFQEGDKGEVLYILNKGIVKLFKIDLEGHEKTLAILKPPEFFGEMALLGEQGRSATALSIRETLVYLLFKDDFQRLIKEYPSISLNVANTLSQRLYGANDEAQVLSYKDAQGRVAYVILRLYWGGLIDFNDEGKAKIRFSVAW